MSGTGYYASNQVTAVVCAIPLTDGLVEDEFIKVEPIGVLHESQLGADGFVTINKLNDPRWKITVNLLGASPHNEQISALFGVGGNNDTGAVVGVFFMKDNNGTTMYAASKCWPVKHAGSANGKTSKDKTWEFECIMNYGGAISGGNKL